MNYIASLEDKLLNAIKERDFKVLDDLLNNDLIFRIPSGKTVNMGIDYENFRKGFLKISSIKQIELQISEVGSSAIVSAVIDVKGIYGNKKIDGMYRYIRVWKKMYDSWKIVGGAGMRI